MSDITHREIREHYEHNPHCFFVLFWGKKNNKTPPANYEELHDVILSWQLGLAIDLKPQGEKILIKGGVLHPKYDISHHNMLTHQQ